MTEDKETKPISAPQLIELDKFQKRRDGQGKPLSDEQIAKLEYLIDKRDNPPKPSVGKGCQSYLLEMYALEKYGKNTLSREAKIKYTEKGHLVEQQAIDILSFMDDKIYTKNDLRLSNGYITGELDIFEGESIDKATNVIDIKAPWDLFSFLNNIGRPLSNQYWWQMQGYLALTGAPVGEVCFLLVNTPESLITDEQRWLLRNANILTEENPEYKRLAQQIHLNMTFDDIPMEERIIRYQVTRDDEAIQKVYERVELCREWLTNFEDKHLNPQKYLNCIKDNQNEEDNG